MTKTAHLLQGVSTLLVHVLFRGKETTMFEFLGIITEEGSVDKNAVAIYIFSAIFALDLLVNVLRV